MREKGRLIYISLFAGIGGFDLALNRLGHTCVWANEWDKYAAQIYNKNFEETPCQRDTGPRTDSADINGKSRAHRRSKPTSGIDTRDIRTVPTSEIPDHDLLVGGFPCQAFSIAGKRRGFDDTRGTLFFEIARILKDKQPKYFILENVKGLLSHDNGNTFKTIIATLTELGYDLEWQVLNSKNFGVPQNRERVFIVGHLRGESGPKVFPIAGSNGENVSSQREINQLNQPVHSNDRVNGKDGISPSLNTMQGGRRQPKVMLSEHRTELGKKTRREIRKKEGRDSTLRGREHKEYRPNTNDLANCITTGKENIEKWLIDFPRIRRLTPTECERLQGFPDGWTEGISDTQRYKCLGNAVTVNVVYEVAKSLTRILIEDRSTGLAMQRS